MNTGQALTLTGKGGFSYQHIYKNLMRDIRKFLIDAFNAFKTNNYCKFKFRNLQIKDKFFPLQILEFTKTMFSPELMQMFGGQGMHIDLRELAFTIASFI